MSETTIVNDGSKRLTRGDLDRAMCSECGGNHPLFALTQDCHPDAGAFPVYSKRAGTLLLVCGDCNNIYATVVVSPEQVH